MLDPRFIATRLRLDLLIHPKTTQRHGQVADTADDCAEGDEVT